MAVWGQLGAGQSTLSVSLGHAAPPPTSALGFLHSVMAGNGENTGVKVRGSPPGFTLLAMLVSWSLCASVSSSVKWG